MSELYQSLSHSKWDCKHHVVFVPKRRRKANFGQTRRQLGQIFHGLARQCVFPLSIQITTGTGIRSSESGFVSFQSSPLPARTDRPVKPSGGAESLLNECHAFSHGRFPKGLI